MYLFSIGIDCSKNATITIPSSHCGLAGNSGTIRPWKLLMSVNDRYLPVFLNWLEFYSAVCPDFNSIHLLCIDREVHRKIKKYNLLPCANDESHSFDASNNLLWLERAQVTKKLLFLGYDVLMSDADALWIQNPFDIVNKQIHSDIIASRGSFPEDVYNKIGLTYIYLIL